MTTERRTDARGKSSARVTFTDATSDTPSEGELHDIGRGGMFIATKSPLPAGKRIDVEVHGQASPITGMGRVIWVRAAAQGDLPAGMGVKFIDVDDAALAAIDKLVGLKKNVRERTVLGIAAPVPPKAEVPKPDATVKVQVAVPPEAKPEAPKPMLKSRERTVLGVAPPAQAREKELSWDDMPAPEPTPAAPPAKKESSAPAITIGEASLSEPVNFSEPGLVLPKEEAKAPEPVHEPVKEPEPEPVREPEPMKESEPLPLVAKAVEPEPAPAKKPVVVEPSMPEPRELPKRESGGAGKWIVILLLLAGAGGAAYYFRDKIFPPPAPLPTPSASASASVAPSASASAAPSATVAEVIDAAATTTTDAAATAAEDASALATALDAGVRDGGNHDAAKHHDAGAVHAHPHPKPTATATGGGNDNPY